MPEKTVQENVKYEVKFNNGVYQEIIEADTYTWCEDERGTVYFEDADGNTIFEVPAADVQWVKRLP